MSRSRTSFAAYRRAASDARSRLYAFSLGSFWTVWQFSIFTSRSRSSVSAQMLDSVDNMRHDDGNFRCGFKSISHFCSSSGVGRNAVQENGIEKWQPSTRRCPSHRCHAAISTQHNASHFHLVRGDVSQLSLLCGGAAKLWRKQLAGPLRQLPVIRSAPSVN